GGEAKRVDDADPFAHVVHGRYAEGTVASKMQDHVGPNPAQAGHQVGHIVIGPQGGVGTAVPQGEHHELVVVRAGDDQGQVLVLVAGEDAVDAGADHLQEGVFGEVGGAGVVEGIGEGPGQADALVELADGDQPGVAGELAC